MNAYKIYAVDFDGTLCENKWPEIGEPIQDVIDFCKRVKEDGNKLILWTCRKGEKLNSAIEWCNKRGLVFHAINKNLPEIIEEFNGDCRKIFANYYIDDRNLSINDIK